MSAVRAATRQVRPILSISQQEARSRVLSLYKAWYRQAPFIVQHYDIPKNEAQIRAKIREEFLKNANVKDIRVIDLLVIKAQMELKEVCEVWHQKGTLMNHFKDTQEKKPTDFLSKFLSGQD
ncbi:NADH dehydrogenase [ubiquinone] 1 alpha subcomplex subunit 6 [Athalia rosae]|uniref:NADH dehydrogenase [ubiquinone] 1 alpha subcomplex subunit 6 n=1 Tax=Athalia rosae TaxID=37344 RepID=UPI0020347BD6|nr:NADH dehydrogenase [ubiquinone] 1 alpha subcomplex subunit 6 [Athalia rosae]